MDGGAWQATVHRVSKSQRGLSDFTFPFPDSSVKNPPAMQETPVRFLGQEDSPGERIGYSLQYSWASLVAQLIKNLPAMWETWVGRLPWRRKRLPIPVFWPGEFHGLYNQ